MTIAAGLICSDGAVLCADTQLTANYKQQGPKLWLHRKAGVFVAVTGAGDYGLLKLANEHIRRRLRSRQTIDHVRHGILEPVLASIYTDHIDRAPDWRVQSGYDLSLLVAVKTDTRIVVYESSRTTVAEVTDYRCLGSGSPVGNYIAGTMFTSSLSVFWGEVLAAYLIQQTKTYGEDCGGNSAVVVLPKEGDGFLLPSDKVKQMETVGNRIHEALGPVFFSLSHEEWKGAQFAEVVGEFQMAVMQGRHDIATEMIAFLRSPSVKRFFDREARREARRDRKSPKREPKSRPASQG